MQFAEGDRILRRTDRLAGRISQETEPPRPFRVNFEDGTEGWCEPEYLMLECKCDLSYGNGCVCGAAKRERQ